MTKICDYCLRKKNINTQFRIICPVPVGLETCEICKKDLRRVHLCRNLNLIQN